MYKILCVAEKQVWITEIMIDDHIGEQWIEVYNYGIDFTLSDLSFLGLVEGAISEDVEFNQGEFYIFGNTDPCNGSCNFISLTDRDDTDIAMLDDDDGTIDSVSITSEWTNVANGYSYELKSIYFPNSEVQNWRESCVRGGSPGEANSYPCSTVCDAEKCQSAGDNEATCNGQTTGVVYNTTCNCTTNYLYDDSTRSCDSGRLHCATLCCFMSVVYFDFSGCVFFCFYVLSSVFRCRFFSIFLIFIGLLRFCAFVFCFTDSPF